MSKALIYSDKIENYGELAGAAKSLGKEAVAYVISNKADAEKVSKYVPEVYYTEAGDKIPESFCGTFKSVADKVNPDVILIYSTKRGKLIAARIAASYDTSVLTDIGNMAADGANITGTQMYYGGSAINTVKNKAKAIVTISAGSYEALAADAAGAVTEVASIDTDSKIVVTDRRSKSGSTVNLAAAKRVVGVGRGFSKQEDLSLAEDLASALGAEIGCSRPIAEGEGWMGTDRYIGVSGVMLKPDLYIAVGISGQIQHTIGVSSAKTIIAVNKDKNAPIFKQCDYGIVCDLTKILPELTKLIKG